MARWKDVKKHKSTTKSGTENKVFYAGFWSRFLALSVDVFMIGIPISILIYFAFGYETMQSQPGFVDAIEGLKPEQKANPLIPLLTMSLWSLITLGFWSKSGQTPGKKMANIEIVDNNTLKKASFLKLLVRLLFFIMPIFAFFSFFIMFLNPKKRTLHDMISGTAVIYKN
jgi:uncharacterized RDD family membrane protein YckC